MVPGDRVRTTCRCRRPQTGRRPGASWPGAAQARRGETGERPGPRRPGAAGSAFLIALRHPDCCHVRLVVSCRTHACPPFRGEEAKAQSGYLADTLPGWARNQTAGASTCLGVGTGRGLGPALVPRAAMRTHGRALWPVGLPQGVAAGFRERAQEAHLEARVSLKKLHVY